MTHQVMRYHSMQPKSARLRAPPLSDVIPIAAMVGCMALAIGGPTSTQARPLGTSYGLQSSPLQVLLAREEELNAREALAEIKSTSGLTWAQIAQLLQISRKRLHDWNSGGNLREANEAKLSALLERVRSFSDLPKFKIRAALLGPSVQLSDHDPQPMVVSDNKPPRNRLRLADESELVG